MKVLTFKAKPKTIFGICLAITGVVVIIVSFIGNHTASLPSNANAKIKCSTTEERVDYIESLGWKTDSKENSKQITIPQSFNNIYTEYNKIQKKQGFDLEEYKGKKATIYTYNIVNHERNGVIADLIVVDDVLVGADLCDASVDNGFLVGLNENGQT